MRLPIAAATVALLASALPAAENGRVVNVSDRGSLVQAMTRARPGDVIRLAAGNYGQVHVEEISGTAEQPVIIESADPRKPAVLGGGSAGMHLVRPAHVVLRNLVVRKCTDNGINIDDGGRRDGSAHHVRLENIRVEEIGPRGNHDGIKLSGLDDFEVINCTVTAWGSSGIDMVGCHDGLISGCTFRGREGFEQANGVQIKGGCRHVYVRDCLFVDAGNRGVNLGGSTGDPYFRPPLEKMEKPLYEARDCVVENNRFIGGDSAVAFVTQENCVARFNTVYRPRRWAFRILQETREARFVKSRKGTIENNVVVWRTGDMYTCANVGEGTDAASFVFKGNVWFCENRPSASKADLPAKETGGRIGVDPRLKDPAREDLAITNKDVLKSAGWRAAPTSQPDGG